MTAGMELGIQSGFCQQLGVVALFNNAAMIKHYDQIGIADGGEAVGDDQRRTAVHQPLERHKYHANTTQYHCPCGLDNDREQALKRVAEIAGTVIGIKGWARVDVFIDGNGQYQLIEINTVPGMTDHSLVPMAAKQAGLNFDALVWQILETSLA